MSERAIPARDAGLVTVQRVAADVIGRVLTGKNLDRELADALSQHRVSPNERAAIHSISFDALRHHGLLSAQLDLLLSAPLTDAPVRHLLIVALSQLQFSKVAPHTIVDCAVNAVESAGYARAKGLANAVLRNYLRDPAKFKRERFKDDVARLDHPRWWINRLQKEALGEWEPALASAQLRPPMHLRVNQQRASVTDMLEKFAQQGISATQLCGQVITLQEPLPVQEIPGFAEGLVSVQDAGAQLAAHFLDAQDGMRVLDACAAPGGKTAHILERNRVEMMALDDDPVRLKRVSDNLRRLGLTATVKQGDARQPNQWWQPPTAFDRVLLDVPCSGSGVTRRHPDIKWIRRESDLKSFARAQAGLIAAVWKTLAPGGRLLYATCSVFQIENEEIVSAFLHAQPNAERLPLTMPSGWPIQFARDAKGNLTGTIYPNEQHDGFFYALIAKSAAA